MSVEPPDPPAQDLNLDGALGWLPRFTAVGFQVDSGVVAKGTLPGPQTLPLVDYADGAFDFTHH
jgi:hypothetical protein